MGTEHRRKAGVWSKLAVLVVSAVAGFTFVSGAFSAKGSDLRPTGGDTASLVKERADRVAAKRLQAHGIQNDIESLSETVTDKDTSQNRAKYKKLQPQTGLTPVDGPGVRVTLSDAPRSVEAGPGVDPNVLVVHQQDIQSFVNALWAGGARAITLQGQRLISTTGIKCVGNTVVLEGVPYSPPYEIEAVGDPASLQFALNTSSQVDTYRQYANKYKLGLEVETLDHVTADAYSSGIDLQYADVADG